MRLLFALSLIPSLALAQADGGTAAAPKAGLDVSKMPFSREGIVQVIDSHKNEITACYEQFLAGAKKPEEGVVKTQFAITPQGKVKHAKIDHKGTTLKNGELQQCILGVVSGMDFPTPPDNRDHPIEYPFKLKAVH